MNIRKLWLSDLAIKRKYNQLVKGKLDLRKISETNRRRIFEYAHEQNYEALDIINNKLIKNYKLQFADLIEKSNQYNDSIIAIRIINNYWKSL